MKHVVTKKEAVTWWGIPRVAWIAAGIMCVIASVISLQQLGHAVYDRFDLAIIEQVLWNTAQGRWFEYTFSPHSYLVDHRSWLIVPFSFLYRLLPYTQTLLIAQAGIIASGVLPFTLIARKVLSGVHIKSRYIVWGAVTFYVLQPSLWALTLFEFHMLPLAVPLFFWVWWTMISRRWMWCAVLISLLLLLREDTGLLICGLGLLLMISPSIVEGVRSRVVRSIGGGLVVVGLTWFISMLMLGTVVSPYDAPKFIVFYDWAGTSPGEIVWFALTHPLKTLGVFFGYDHFAVVVLYILMTGAVSLKRFWYALPALPFMTLLFFNDGYNIWSMVKGHYAAVLLPSFMIAAVYGYRWFVEDFRPRRIGKWIKEMDLHIFWLMLPILLTFTHIVLLGSQWELVHRFRVMNERSIDSYEVAADPSHFGLEEFEPIMVSERVYTFASRRELVYPSMHVFTGLQHFTTVPYDLPEVRYLVLEHESLLRYDANLPFEYMEFADDRIGQIITDNDLVPVESNEELVVFLAQNVAEGSGVETVPLWSLNTKEDRVLEHDLDIESDDLRLTGWEPIGASGLRVGLEKISETIELENERMGNQNIEVVWFDGEDRELKRRAFSIGVGVVPTSSWEMGDRYSFDFTLRHPKKATRAVLRLGGLDLKVGSKVGLWRSEPGLVDDAIQVELTDLFE